MTIVELQMLVSIIAMLITIGTALWSWLSAGSRKNEKLIAGLGERVVGLNERVVGHGARLDQLEGHVQHQPSNDDIHAIRLSLRDLKSEIAVLSERVKPLIATTERINELLLEQARKNL